MVCEDSEGRWIEFLSGVDQATEHNAEWTYVIPQWLDEEKFRRGQNFGKSHLVGVLTCNLIMLLNFSRISRLRKPLIYSGNSKTPVLAYKRVLKTTFILLTWYDGNVWDVDNGSRKNLELVKKLHKHYSVKTNQIKTEIDLLTIIHSGEEIPASYGWQQCPMGEIWCREGESPYFSQFDMAMTQYAFCGLLLAHPEKFGIHGASREDLEDFIHFWRGIGYLLGIQDKYNLCSGNYDTVMALCDSIETNYVRPAFIDIDPDTMIAQRVTIEGMKMVDKVFSYEALMHYTLSHVLGMDSIKELRPQKFMDWISFYSFYIIFNILCRLQRIQHFFSKNIKYRLQKVFHRDDFSSERHTFLFPLPE